MDFERLDAILKERGISRRKLALAVGIKEGTMSTAFMRRSGLSSGDLLRIARYLGVNPLYLEGLSDNLSMEDYEDHVEFALENSDEVRLEMIHAAYEHLNTSGRIEAVKRVGELTEIPRYTQPGEQED